MLLVLGAAALFVHLRLRADLDDRIDASLRSRAVVLLQPAGPPTLTGVALEDLEESFVQLLSTEGVLLASAGTVRGPALTRAEIAAAVAGSLTVERHLPGVDGRARMLALPGDSGSDGAAVVVVGQSLVDRDDALSNVVSSFAVGGVVALLVTSLIGYALASAALAPVEAMRRRARDVSLRAGDEGLPLPAAHDEVRRLAETLNEMLARLREAFDRESRFVSDASHELRTPIAIIKTELEGALHQAGPDAAVHPALVVAVEECDRLAQLAEDLLVIARTSDGRVPIRREPTDVEALLAGVRDRYVDRAARRGRPIRVTCEPGLVVAVDPVRVRQALGNLVENALRHGDGAVTMVGGATRVGVSLEVSDEGEGFPPDLVDRAFERFSRGDPSRSSEGVGLGLAIVAAIALAHDGGVSVVPQGPTTVRLLLPSGR